MMENLKKPGMADLTNGDPRVKLGDATVSTAQSAAQAFQLTSWPLSQRNSTMANQNISRKKRITFVEHLKKTIDYVIQIHASSAQ